MRTLWETGWLAAIRAVEVSWGELRWCFASLTRVKTQCRMQQAKIADRFRSAHLSSSPLSCSFVIPAAATQPSSTGWLTVVFFLLLFPFLFFSLLFSVIEWRLSPVVCWLCVCSNWCTQHNRLSDTDCSSSISWARQAGSQAAGKLVGWPLSLDTDR